MENLSKEKINLRKILLERRKNIPEKRRVQASEAALVHLKGRGRLLSFTSIGSEIDLSLLNGFLKEKNSLYLVPYRIDALFKAPLEIIDAILVPALGFDKNGFRIGYGKGFYDRFLAQVKNTIKIGVGFEEQLCETVPIDPWDVPVDELLLL